MSTMRNLRLLDAVTVLVDEIMARGTVAAMKKHGMTEFNDKDVHAFVEVVDPIMDNVRAHVLEGLTHRLYTEVQCVEAYIGDFDTGMLIHNDPEYVVEEMTKED